MKLSKTLKSAALFTGAIALTSPILPALAQFTEAPVEQSEVVAVAVPAGAIGYNLNVVQQVAGKQQCYAEVGSEPTIIDPLWTTFDFSGSCNRATDGNGYSVRLDGQDTSLDYRLDVIPKGDNLQLVAKSFKGSGDLVVGQTFGKPGDGEYAKIHLNPGWEFTKKEFEGKVLGHFFLSGDSQAIAAASGQTITPPKADAFTDIGRDIYKDQIESAVALGFISGFKDRTFKPSEPLTREQLVSIVYDALGTIEDFELAAADNPTTSPFPDVEADRWSAGKVAWAASNQIVTGYEDGSFKPAQPVTRAELMAVLNKVAIFANAGEAELTTNGDPVAFADTSDHWAKDTISTMSAYCGVASAYQEVGDAFQPNTPAARSYAATATLRTHECISGEK